jgi:hypothetical protein
MTSRITSCSSILYEPHVHVISTKNDEKAAINSDQQLQKQQIEEEEDDDDEEKEKDEEKENEEHD